MIRNSSSRDRDNRRYIDDYEPTPSWDGRERRQIISPRFNNDYDGEERRHHTPSGGDTIVIEQPKDQPKPNVSWIQSNFAIIGFLVTAIIIPGGTFIFDLYNNVRTLEYKQATIFEKITENKQLAEEIKTMIKEGDKSRKDIEQQINSLEDTIMQMYSRKK